MNLLRPTLFRVIVNGVNRIGGYNKETDVYESPTVARNFGTLIKKCCDLAYILLLQKPNTENRREELKVLKTLVESQWANEVSAQAGDNLNSNKWNKEELLPLTTDLRKLRDYLEANAQKSYEELSRDENNQYAYKSLKEILYTQIILMNRRRPAEVSQIKLHTYRSINLDLQEKENEFESILTETEKILLKSCSRIVIRGKRGRGVPILFSQKMRQHLDFLIKMRERFVKDNDYIFHTDGKSFLDGTKILYKYAEKCGVENPKSINATKLLQFSKSDLEQLSRFMGHTLKTHCDFYRLSDSTYQTAKISKLLLLATEGGLEKYKGLSLDEINIDMNPIVEECDFEERTSSILDEMPNNVTSPTEKKEFIPHDQEQTRKKCVHPKMSWSAEHKKIIAKYFEKHIESKRAPKEHEITRFRKEYPGMFDDRKWTSVKAVVYNIFTGKLIISD
ncbi:uncharacterized protein isoform X1 [Leptinotarsa decemlineata]|uniref:uncharacterized protein isoform X1 n=1 Tax=Leptinotarsa decemlineata TaxID=7539 RepID=UPI003D3042C4